MPLLEVTDRGIYCPAGDFHIDPWKPVEYAVLTHAHADHARRGSTSYVFSAEGERVFRTRLGDITAQPLQYGEEITRNGVKVSLHPAGHILGSAQARVEHKGEIAVVSGDYKLGHDPTCTPFEPVRCHTFITESTFGLPVFRWPDPTEVMASINQWWKANAEKGKASLLLSYSLGKAQRLLHDLDPETGPIFLHGAAKRLTDDYREAGIALPETEYATADHDKKRFRNALIIAPPSALGSSWTDRFGPFTSGFASGWMQIRGTRRRRAADRGFILSDHADWQGLQTAIEETGAENIFVTHGYTEIFARWLREQGYNADVLDTLYRGESVDGSGDVGDIDITPDATEETTEQGQASAEREVSQ
jgi:putative mRNA 3-end processing factor